MTILDKDVAGHRLFEAGSPHAGRWAVRLMKTASGDDHIVPSDYGLGKSLGCMIASGEKTELFNRQTGGFHLRLLSSGRDLPLPASSQLHKVAK